MSIKLILLIFHYVLAIAVNKTVIKKMPPEYAFFDKLAMD